MEVVMISCGVEISIAGGVAETEDALTIIIITFFFLFESCYLLLLSGQTHNSAHPTVLGTTDC